MSATRAKKPPGPRPDPESKLSQAKAIASALGLSMETTMKWWRLPGGMAAGLRRFYLNQEARALGKRSE